MKCVVCGKEFEKQGPQVTCKSRECRNERVRILRAKKKGVECVPLKRIECEICGKSLMQRLPGQVICGADECKLALGRVRQKARRPPAPKLPPRPCPICGKVFTPCRKDAVNTCGELRCRRARERRIEAERRAKFAFELEVEAALLAEQKRMETLAVKISNSLCPFRGYVDEKGHREPSLRTLITEYPSYDFPEMDPMTNRMETGVWVNIQDVRSIAA